MPRPARGAGPELRAWAILLAVGADDGELLEQFTRGSVLAAGQPCQRPMSSVVPELADRPQDLEEHPPYSGGGVDAAHTSCIRCNSSGL